MSGIKRNETRKMGNSTYSRNDGGRVCVTNPNKSTRYTSTFGANQELNRRK